MSTWHDEDDERDEGEEPDEADQDEGDEESDTVPCPACGEPVYEDAERCCHCGEYITPAQVARRPSWWFIITVILAILAVLSWLSW